MSKDIVVIGTSTGGLEALNVLMAGLPHDFAGSCFVVRHTRHDSPGLLATLLERVGALPAFTVTESMPIEPGKIYVAAPDRHLLIEPGVVFASSGPKENRFRPAVDPLFRSAAKAYGPRTVGLVLTGGLDDGTQGLSVIKSCGGTAVVQDPNEAVADSMPRSALAYVDVDYCLPIADMAALLVRLTAEYIVEAPHKVEREEELVEFRIAKGDEPIAAGVLGLGDPSPFTCPECHGVLLRMKQAGIARFRCHTGHAYSINSLLSELEQSTEDALWNALRCLHEQKFLLTHLAEHLADAKQTDGSAEAQERARQARIRSATLQALLTGERSELGR